MQKDDIAHNLRIYTNSNVAIKKLSGETVFGKLIRVDYDELKNEYYALLFLEKRVCRIYENEIETIFPFNNSSNDSIINSIRTVLSEKYLLWDNGVITGRTNKFPVVNIINSGSSIRVDYCNDLGAEDIEFFDIFKMPDVDMIVQSIDSTIEKYEKKKLLGLGERKNR